MFLAEFDLLSMLQAAVVFLAFLAYMLLRPCRYHFHMLQLNTYVNREYQSWLRKQPRARLIWSLVLCLSCLAFFFAGSRLTPGFCLASLVVGIIFFPLSLKPAKKPLVFTKRMKRLFRCCAGLLVLFGLLVLGFLPLNLACCLLLLACCLPWGFVLLSNRLMAPVEKRINRKFFCQAQSRLRSMPDLTTVGITGSYGKTSVKMILGSILAEEFETLVTPHSYNTPMGVSLTVNNQLRPVTEVFVCEMGARHRQDIAEMCDLAQPDIAVLTAIGEQHLETFGSQENIIAAKFDILRALPADGRAVVNGDNALIRDNLGEFSCPIYRYGLNSDNDYWADEISFDKQGTSFVLHAEGQTWPLRTSLLGRHNVCNILGGIAVARLLGMDMKKISRSLLHIPQIEHRLQLMNAGSYTVIDDAFNSNPAGAAAALELLSSFEGGKKIIITPGMVELGERQDALNREFGASLPPVCDHIILVGKKHSRPIYEGAMAAGCREGQLLVAADLNEARSMLAGLVQNGDVVLFENDLPDTYNE